MASEDQKKFKLFADNLRKTALGVKFSKALFNNPYSLSPKQIVDTMKALGVDIPPGIQMTAEAAQIYISGQAVYEGIQGLSSAKDLSAATNATAASIKALTYLAASEELIDSDTQSCLLIGTDVALIISSAGMNVQAWVQLGLDLTIAFGTKQGEADYSAFVQAQNYYNSRLAPQGAVFSETIKDFQNGSMSIYGVIASLAAESPDLWPQVINPNSPIAQMFPDLLMLPTIRESYTFEGTSEISGDWPWPASGRWVAARWNGYKSVEFNRLGTQLNKETSAEYFFELLLKPWIISYAMANNEVVGRGNMSMENVAALSYLVNPNGEISDKYPYVNMLIGSYLTPYDFNDPILADISKQFVNDHYKGVDTSFHEQGLSFGLTQQNVGFQGYNSDMEIMRRKLEKVQQTDDIVELVQYPYIYQKLQDYMDFEEVSFEKDPTLGGKINQKFSSNDVRAWRKLHNYIAVLNMLDQFRKDKYLSTTRFAQNLMPFMPSVDSFDAKVKRLQMLSTARAVNHLANKNIAEFMGVDNFNKLKNVNPDQGAAVMRYK